MEIKMLSKAQSIALKSYAEEGEAPDYGDYSDRAGPAFGWLNRERVITALIRKGLIDADQKITEAGLAALSNLDK